MKAKSAMLVIMVGLLAYLITRGKTKSAPDSVESVDNTPAANSYGTVYINNDMSPIQLPAPNPIYQAYYTTSPGIPDVTMNFTTTIQNENLDYGYIPLFGLIPQMV